MRLLTLNIWNYARPWPVRRDAIVRLISTLQPDVVALQETRHDFRFDRGLGQGTQLAQRTGYAITWGLAQTYLPIARIDEGLTILSRETPRRQLLKHLTLLPHDRQDENRRICLGVELLAGERTVNVFCTHFSLSANARLQNARDVSAFVETECGYAPTFVMGDLNEPPHGPALRYLTEEAGFLDVWPAVNPDDPGFTYASWQPYHRIDYILARNLARLPHKAHLVGGREAQDDVHPSDHLGILVEALLD